MTHCEPETYSVEKISELTRLSVRQIQRLANKKGKDQMPGVKPHPNGYHKIYEKCPELEKWIEKKRKERKGRRKEAIEANDTGTKNFGTLINRLVVLNGKFERGGNFDDLDPEALFDLHRDFLPVVKIWAGFVKRFDGQLPPDLEAQFKVDLQSLSPNT